MANTIRIKRGLKADLAKMTLLAGELGVALDTQELYIGDENGNVKIVKGGASGAVESADKLTVARTISVTGDATGSVAFDGSQNVEMALELANSGVTAGTYTKVTVDAKGRVTTGANITVEDIGDLSDTLATLATKEELKSYVKTTEMNTALENKVDKVAGKSLISDTEIARLKEEEDKYYSLCSGLYEDLKEGIITKSEFERLHSEFKRKAGEFEEAQKKQELMLKELFKNGAISAARLKTMQDCAELREIDRYTLCSMVKKISVYENHRIEIEFYYTDQYRIMREVNKRIKDEQKKNCLAERSA